MITYIFYYVSIGVFLNFLFDRLVSSLDMEEYRFGTYERVFTTLLWPLSLIIFIYGFITTYRGK